MGRAGWTRFAGVVVVAAWVAACSGGSGTSVSLTSGDASSGVDGHATATTADSAVVPACNGACDAGAACKAGSDCTSKTCQAGKCAPASCTDGKQDGNETGVDCGGSCQGCPTGGGCVLGKDCAGLVCATGPVTTPGAGGGPIDCPAGASCTCQAPDCTDGLKNGAETGVDCGGGTCPACAVGGGCAVDTDCASSACDVVSKQCVADPCADHHKDGAETDVDCGGGTCPACAVNAACAADTDCTTSACDAVSKTCVASQCADHQKDGSETDVDCGGGTCPACAVNAGCAVDTDCTTSACDAVSKTCDASQCGDHQKDGAETDVDCGGGACPACALTQGCLVDTDCATNACDAAGNTCVADQCADHHKDGAETDVDCGGGTCAPCVVTKGCSVDSDCVSSACDAVSNTCVSSQCADHRQDGKETDVDCGGGTCAPCVVPDGCSVDSDCVSNACDASDSKCVTSQCADHRQDGKETDVDCGGGTCPACALTDGCSVDADCVSNACDAVSNKCVASQCTDHHKDGAETDVDCGGGTCPACALTDGCSVDADCVSNACDAVSNKCVASQCADHRKDGAETDVDCGGGTCPACAKGLSCSVAADCTSGGCTYLHKCADSISCTPQHGGDTCGATGATESCCTTLPSAGLPQGKINGVTVTTTTVDKYNITAGRMRAFVTATNGNLRGWITAHTPAWWNATWTNYLPNVLDDGAYDGPHCTGAAGVTCGTYQEFGPVVHGTAGGGNMGCEIQYYGARSYRLPDAVNASFGDPQSYTQDFDDERAMNCVDAYILSAFCAWDGGHLPTLAQLDHVWGAGTYPWGTPAGPAPANPGHPVGYLYANPGDPQNGVVGGPLSYSTLAWGAFQAAPLVAYTAPPTAGELKDLEWANYNYNYWGGATQLGTDYTIYIAPPGRYPLGNGPYGHSDLAGSVFQAADLVGTNDCWSRSGSWQGHGIPYAAAGSCGVNLPATNKYWAMGARCAR